MKYPQLGSPVHDNLMYAAYYAPRGRMRMYMLGGALSQRYLTPNDLLVGVIGAEGSGKSTLIKALFPGLELTNDDDGVNVRPTPLLEFSGDDFFAGHTFHIDYRYESAFHSKFEILDAIRRALAHQRRVIVEHFDLVYDDLGFNAHLLFGIGEEIIVCRPNAFGPHPAAIHSVVSKTIRFRRMAHSAEDLTCLVLQRDYGIESKLLHSDVKHGFVLRFDAPPPVNLCMLQTKVRELIEADLPIQSADEQHIRVGGDLLFCTGVRTHVKRTGEIENFRLIKEIRHDELSGEHLIIGLVGKREPAGFEDLVPLLDE